ncbi:UNVERIFIED_ORG: hypothetical protein ABIB52_004571 [Arthrobacter sp. UYCu721]
MPLGMLEAAILPSNTATGVRGSGKVRARGIGYDYVHVAIDDNTRFGYAELLPDGNGATAAGFLIRAASYFAGYGIQRIERVITYNAPAYRNSTAFRQAVADQGAVQRVPHRPEAETGI